MGMTLEFSILSGWLFQMCWQHNRGWCWESPGPAYLCAWVKAAWNSCSGGSGWAQRVLLGRDWARTLTNACQSSGA